MGGTVTVVGSPLSPYVRKVLVVLQLKGLPYLIDPIVPFYGDDRFSQLSPLRNVPVLIDGATTLADSSVICQYLEDRYPAVRLYPEDIVARAEARWLEEYADTRMGGVIISMLFNQLAIRPAVWGREPDQEKLAKARDVDLPHVLDYLDSRLPAAGFLFGELSIADIAIACFFRNARFVRYTIDPERWPRTAAFVERMLALAPFAALKPIEDILRHAPLSDHRKALREKGVPLTVDTFATTTPRQGMMAI